jgi:hypothetical protein
MTAAPRAYQGSIANFLKNDSLAQQDRPTIEAYEALLDHEAFNRDEAVENLDRMAAAVRDRTAADSLLGISGMARCKGPPRTWYRYSPACPGNGQSRHSRRPGHVSRHSHRYW